MVELWTTAEDDGEWLNDKMRLDDSVDDWRKRRFLRLALLDDVPCEKRLGGAGTPEGAFLDMTCILF